MEYPSEQVMRHRLRWAVHNLIAHPAMVFLPAAWGDWFHDVTIPADNPKEP